MCKLAYSKPLSRTGDGDSSERHCGEAERNEDRKGRNADGRAQYRIIYFTPWSHRSFVFFLVNGDEE